MDVKKNILFALLLFLYWFGLPAAASLSVIDHSKFRLSYAEMQEIANAKLLPHRIFYDSPSQGADAVWFDAVKQGNLTQIQQMVAAGQNLEAKDEASLGQTALGWAAFIGYLDIVEYLVAQGADLYATDRADVYNTMKSAVMGKNVKVVQFLHHHLGAVIDWNAREQDNETLFMVAAVNGRLEIVKYILQFNPDINVIAINDNPKINASPLSGACEHGFSDTANLLIQQGAINHKTARSSC